MSEKIKCRNCGRLTEPENRFCPSCGAVLQTEFRQEPGKEYCPFCGSEIPDGAAACPVCGTPAAGMSDTAVKEATEIGHEPYAEPDEDIDITEEEPEVSEEEARPVRRVRPAEPHTGNRGRSPIPAILILLLAAALIFFLTPFAGKYQLTKLFRGGSGEESSPYEDRLVSGSDASSKEDSAEETPAATTAPTEVPAAEPTAEPTPTPRVTPLPTEKPAPEPTPTPEVQPEEEKKDEAAQGAEPETVPAQVSEAAAQIMEEAPAAAQAVAADSGIIPDSSTRALTYADLDGRTAREIRLIANEIYARNGYTFKKQEYTDYFSQFSWYVPTVPAGAFDDSMLSPTEKANVDLVQQYELEHNINQGLY